MTKPILFLLFSLMSLSLVAQENFIRKFYKNYKESDSADADMYYDYFLTKTSSRKGYYVKYTIEGIKLETCECSFVLKKEREGICTLYNENGTIKAIETFKNNKWEGILKSYYDNGQLRREDLYKEGEFVSGKCYTASGADTAHFHYYKIAEPVGGVVELNRHIATNFIYPEEARRNDIQGKVFVGFIIDYDGSVTEVHIARGVHKLLDDEAMRVIKTLPKFIPAISEGRPDRTNYIIPVNARLR